MSTYYNYLVDNLYLYRPVSNFSLNLPARLYSRPSHIKLIFLSFFNFLHFDIFSFKSGLETERPLLTQEIQHIESVEIVSPRFTFFKIHKIPRISASLLVKPLCFIFLWIKSLLVSSTIENPPPVKEGLLTRVYPSVKYFTDKGVAYPSKTVKRLTNKSDKRFFRAILGFTGKIQHSVKVVNLEETTPQHPFFVAASAESVSKLGRTITENPVWNNKIRTLVTRSVRKLGFEFTRTLTGARFVLAGLAARCFENTKRSDSGLNCPLINVLGRMFQVDGLKEKPFDRARRFYPLPRDQKVFSSLGTRSSNFSDISSLAML